MYAALPHGVNGTGREKKGAGLTFGRPLARHSADGITAQLYAVNDCVSPFGPDLERLPSWNWCVKAIRG